ncbi:hypothetical protein C3Y08_01690 [Burkholderia gladioli]|uniref:hypothetical protein n=1 Tax=Burkholderia gladioli TaxID=28095 RepID=UPI000CDB135B|nr:hypothetical protein [Burkholderia gladioli]POS10186.1 hypothetical protein C3Y08_01690 [Burkholderia gladioli]
MNDRELLGLAAKAAGISGVYARFHQAYGDQWVDGIDTGAAVLWNSLADDGDALRLAVKLELRFEARPKDGGVFVWKVDADIDARKWAMTSEGIDVYEAARLAITRAAAEIGACITTEGGK